MMASNAELHAFIFVLQLVDLSPEIALAMFDYSSQTSYILAVF